MGNPLAKLAGITKAIDQEARKASGVCPVCGKDKGGLVLNGQTKAEANICECVDLENKTRKES